MAREVDPLVGFQFSLDVNGMTGYFTEVSGIGSENAVVTHKVVTTDAKEVTLQIPGRVEWGEVTLKRGLTTNIEFWEWREAVVTGTVATARQDCTITMYDREYAPVVVWNLVNAWPSKLSGPSIASDSNDFTIEELTIVHEGLYRDEMADSIPAQEPAA
ncbi:MAG: phage tail protein [Litorilinea sp.]